MKDEYLWLTDKYNWVITKDKEVGRLLQVEKGDIKINIYWGTGTVIIYRLGKMPETHYKMDFDDIHNLLKGSEDKAEEKNISMTTDINMKQDTYKLHPSMHNVGEVYIDGKRVEYAICLVLEKEPKKGSLLLVELKK